MREWKEMMGKDGKQMKLQMLCAIIWTSLFACSDPKASQSELEKANVGLLPVPKGVAQDSLRIATLNMSVGWHAEDLVLKTLTDSLVVFHALKDLYSQYQATEPSRRMRATATSLLQSSLDVICLQETQSMFAGDTVQFHYVDSLLQAMRNLDSTRHWTVFRQSMNRVKLSVDSAGNNMALEFYEGNAILVDERLSVLTGTDMQAEFNAQVKFNILTEAVGSTRGYQKLVVRTPGGALWQLFNTHLEIAILPNNMLQGQELNEAVWDAWQNLDSGAQVVVGDLNSESGEGGVGAMTSTKTGLVDLWTLGSQSDSLGFTCCVPDFSSPAADYDRRIDYVLARNILPGGAVERIPLFQDGFWGSDHALLKATLYQ
jgi:endonuclease/exonuclease/phosphatase family metal-dependent hydrolase